MKSVPLLLVLPLSAVAQDTTLEIHIGGRHFDEVASEQTYGVGVSSDPWTMRVYRNSAESPAVFAGYHKRFKATLEYGFSLGGAYYSQSERINPVFSPFLRYGYLTVNAPNFEALAAAFTVDL